MSRKSNVVSAKIAPEGVLIKTKCDSEPAPARGSLCMTKNKVSDSCYASHDYLVVFNMTIA